MAKPYVFVRLRPRLQDPLSPPPPSLSPLRTDQPKPSPSYSYSSSPSPSPSRRVSLHSVVVKKAQMEASPHSPISIVALDPTSLVMKEEEKQSLVVIKSNPPLTVDSKLHAEEREWNNNSAMQEQKKVDLVDEKEEEERIDGKKEGRNSNITHIAYMGDHARANDHIRRHSFHGIDNSSSINRGIGGAKELPRRRSVEIKSVKKRRIYVRPELNYQLVEVLRPLKTERGIIAPKLAAHTAEEAEIEESTVVAPKTPRKLLENKNQAAPSEIALKLVGVEVETPESPQKVQEIVTIEVAPKSPQDSVTSLPLSPTRAVPRRRRSSTESLSSKQGSTHSENKPDFPSDKVSNVGDRKLGEAGDENRKESMLNSASRSRGSDDNWDSHQSIRDLMRRRSSSQRSLSRRSESPSIVSSMLQRRSYRESIYTNRHMQYIHGIVRPLQEEGRAEISNNSSIEDGVSTNLFMGLKMKQEFVALKRNLEEEQKLKREEENQKMSRRSVVFITTSINSKGGSMNLGSTSRSEAPTVQEFSHRLNGSTNSGNNTSTIESKLVPLVYPDHCCRHKRRYPHGVKVESSKDIIVAAESDFIPEDRLHITESLEQGLGTIQHYWENQQIRPKSAFPVFKPIKNSTTTTTSTKRYSKTSDATEDSIKWVNQDLEKLLNPPEFQESLIKKFQHSPKKSPISSENLVSVPQQSNYNKEETHGRDPIHQYNDGRKPSVKSLMSGKNWQRVEDQQQSNELDQTPSAKSSPSRNWQRVENHHQSNENEIPSTKGEDNNQSNEVTKNPSEKSSSSTKALSNLSDKQSTATNKLVQRVQFGKASSVQELYRTQSMQNISPAKASPVQEFYRTQSMRNMHTKQWPDEDINEKRLLEKGIAAMKKKQVNVQSIEEYNLSKDPSVPSLLLIDRPGVKPIKSAQGYDQELSQGGIIDQNVDSSSLLLTSSDYIEKAQHKPGMLESNQDLKPQESDHKPEVQNELSDVKEQNCIIRNNIDMSDSKNIPTKLQACIDPDPKASFPILKHSHTFSAPSNTQEKDARNTMEERRRHTAPPESWISDNDGGNAEALMRGEYSNGFLTLNTEDNNVDSLHNLGDGEDIMNSQMDDAEESHNPNILLIGAQIEDIDGAPNIDSEAGSQPQENRTTDRRNFSMPSSSSGINALYSQTGGRMEEESSENSALNEEVLLPSADSQKEAEKNGTLISSSTTISTCIVKEFQKPDSTAILSPQYQRSSLLSSSSNARDGTSETRDSSSRKSSAKYGSMDVTEKGINQSYNGFETDKSEVIPNILDEEEEGHGIDAMQEASSSYMRQKYCRGALMGFQKEDLGLRIEQEEQEKEEEEEINPTMSLQQPRLSLMSTTIANGYGFLSSPKASLPLLQRESQFSLLRISNGEEEEDERRRKSVSIEALQLASPLKNELSDSRARRRSSLQNLSSELPIPEKRSSLQDLDQELEDYKRIGNRSRFSQNERGEDAGYDLAVLMQKLGKRSSSNSLLQAGMEVGDKRIGRSSHSRKNSEQCINWIEDITMKSKPDRSLSEYTKRKKKSSILASSPIEEKERKKQEAANNHHNADSGLLTAISSPFSFLLLLLLLLLFMLAVIPAIRFICQAGAIATHIQNYGEPPT